MTTLPNRFAGTADDLALALEAADCIAHTTRAPRGRWLLPLVQVLTGAAVLVARRVARANW